MQQTFNSMLGWMGGSSSNEPSASVLAEWQKYSGTEGTASSDGVMSTMEDGTARVGMFLSQSFKQVSNTVTEGTGGIQRGLNTVATSRFQVPSSQQLAYFFAFMASGVFFLVLAFSVFLPLIIIAPAKFAFSFSIGGVLILSAFGALRGWQQQMQDMMSKERLPFSVGYVGSVFVTLYAALIMHSYLFSLMCCALQDPLYSCNSHLRLHRVLPAHHKHTTSKTKRCNAHALVSCDGNKLPVVLFDNHMLPDLAMEV